MPAKSQMHLSCRGQSMKRMSRWFAVLVGLGSAWLATVESNEPHWKGHDEFDIIALGRRIKGRVIDHTGNHGRDHRIWSRSLHQWRDLYIYLPPGYNPA